MKVDIALSRHATPDDWDVVRRAFADSGLEVSHEGVSGIKAIDVPGLRIDATFPLEVVVGGALWDLEKEALRHGPAALRHTRQARFDGSGFLSVHTGEGPVIYMVPSGPEGDRAVEESMADDELDPKGPSHPSLEAGSRMGGCDAGY